MEVLQESIMTTCSPARRFKALLINFKKLKTATDTPPSPAGDDKVVLELECPWQDMLHTVAGLCSVALPDMEETAIYSSLTRSGSKTIVLTTTEPQSPDHSITRDGCASTASAKTIRSSGSGALENKATETANHSCSEHSAVDAGGETCDHGEVGECDGVAGATGDSVAGASGEGRDLESSFREIFSESETSETESVGEDEFSEGRRLFLAACRLRRKQCSPGPEDVVAGCGCFMRLSDRPRGSAVQILLLAVRHRWRRAGLGSFLLRTMKDPAVVGHYDALLTFADHKAERFFGTHGFSDDPIITAKYREMVDSWENSSLMAYIPPFSVSSCATGSLAALSLCEDSFKSWKESAIASYCEQLSLMQRLRHEVVLLHSKLESREEDMKMLTEQLKQARRDKSTIELEFANYRKHTQKLLCEAAVEKTQQWLNSAQDSNS